MSVRIEKTLQLSLFTLGFSSLITQVYLLRESIAVFNGNELVIGIVLGNWMLLTGGGAFLGKFFGKIRGKISFLIFLQFIYSLLPLLTILKLDLWKAASVPAGSIPGLDTMLYVTFLLQLPFCLLNGFLFTAFVNLLSETTVKNRAAFSYALESAGGMCAGLIVNLLFLQFLGEFDSLRVLLVINLAVCILLVLAAGKSNLKAIIIPVSVAFMIVPFFSDLQSFTEKVLFPGQEVIFHRSTPYGKIDVTMNSGQLNYFENGLFLFSSGNEIFNEESVHFAMLQHEHPRNILLVSGGISGTTREILKYSPERIDYVELDPALITTGKMFTNNLKNPRIHVFAGDARRFVKQEGLKYDVVLINLPEPLTLLINRYYTVQFLQLLKARLTDNGVISMSLPSSSDYVSTIAVKTNSTLYSTLKVVFRNVLILPGQRNYFLASDSSLSPEITSLVAKRNILNTYVNPWYLDMNSMKERREYIQSQLEKTGTINRDFKPVAFFQQLQYWSSMFKGNHLIAGIIILVLLVLFIISLNRISFGLFTGGMTAASIEILIMVAFQVIYGYVFLMSGIIITIFMAGLAVGAFSCGKIYPLPTIGKFIHLQITLALFSFGFPFLILAMNLPGMPSLFIQVVLILVTFAISFITGLEFSVASALYADDVTKNVSRNYSADLFGSALGAMATTLILLPLTGLVCTSMILVLMNLFSASFLYLKRKK